MVLVALESCAGAVAACAGAGAGSAGVGGCAGVEVIACDDGIALGCEGVAATVAESAVDEVGAGSLEALRGAVALRSFRVGAFALFVERDEWLEAFTLEDFALEGFALGAEAGADSSTGFIDFAGEVADEADSIGALGEVPDGATVVVGPLVSATLDVVEATFVALRAGCATTS